MNEILLLSGLCVFAQIVMIVGWSSVVNQLHAWRTALEKGWDPASTNILEGALPLLSSEAQQKVVTWKSKAHLKEPSAQWFSLSRIEEQRGQSLRTLTTLTGLVVLGALLHAISSVESEPWLGNALLGTSLLSMVLTVWTQQRVSNAIVQCRVALDNACPELPSADNVTRDVMEQLQKQMNLLRNGQKQSLDSLGKSQQTLAKLGENLQFAFQKSVQEQLSPAIQEISQVAVASQQANQRYVEETTRKQSQVVQGLIVQVMDGIDQAIGQSLRDTSESFAASVQRQQVSMDRWRRSVDSVAEVIGALEKTTQGVTLGAERMAQAAQPVEAAARVFSDSAKELQKVFPVVSQLGDMVLQAQSGLTESHAAIQRGTAEYLQVTGNIRSMVSELNKAHEEAIQRIAGGVDDTLIQPFSQMASELQTLQGGQREAFEQLQTMTQSIESTLKQLEGGHDNLSTLAEQIQQAGEPSVQAAAAFVQVSEQLQNIVPQLEQTSQIHEAGAQTMQRISDGLQTENNRNEQILTQVQTLVAQLDATQQQMAERVAKGVDGALADKLIDARQKFVEDVSVASEALKQSGLGVATQFEESTSALGKVLKESSEEAGAHWKQSNKEAADQMQRVGEALMGSMSAQSEQWASTLTETTSNLSKVVSASAEDWSTRVHDSGVVWSSTVERSTGEASTNLIESSQQIANTLKTVGTDWDVQMRSSSQHISDALKKSGSDLNVSLSQVRQQLSDTLSDSTKLLQQSLHQASQTFLEDWGHMGQSIRDALEHASQSLDQSVQEVGRKLNQRIDEAGQSLELSVQQSATSLKEGATHAHDKLSQVGDGWSSAIQEASTSLRDNAQFVSETVSKTLTDTQRDMEGHLAKSLQLLEEQMTQRLNEGIARQQGLIEKSNLQQRTASQHLVDTTEQMTSLLQQSVQQTQSNLQSKLVDFGTDLQVSLQEIFQQYQNGLLSAARQQEIAGQSLLDQAQEAGEKLQQAMHQAQVQTQRSLEKMGADMVLQLGQVHRQYSESLERSQSSMSTLVALQEGHIGSWQELVATLTPALSQLGGSAQQLDSVVGKLSASMKPATTVSENFMQASTQLQAVFPSISETADSYQRFNNSLQQASNALSFTADKYSKAGGDMQGLLGQIEQSLGLQNQSNTAVSQTLQGVQNTIDNLEPVVRLMQQASHDIRVVSEGSTNTIETMKQATESQNQSVQQMGKLSAQLLKTLSSQSSRLVELTGQMEQMQTVLTVGVNAFAQQLPQSVDGTLVQFDAVLAEGVLRINGSIERLREAMDDLIEQLER